MMDEVYPPTPLYKSQEPNTKLQTISNSQISKLFGV
jgi:hypothetical protein